MQSSYRTRPLRILLTVVTVTLSFAASAQCATLGLTPLKLRDTAGTTQQIPAPDACATVLLFIADDCPISNSYAPTIERMVRAYSPRGIAFFIVYAEPGLTDRNARKHDAAYGLTAPSFTAGWRPLVRQTGAIVTPEAVVVDPKGQIRYRGRIDNWFAALGVQRQAATTHDLQSALDDVLANRTVPHPDTTPVGCYIATGVG